MSLAGAVRGQRKRLPKRVLMLAYDFPPVGGAGVQRNLKYVKYLPHEGFEPILVTGAVRRSAPIDRTLGRDVPAGTLISRVREPPLQQAAWALDDFLRRLGLPRRVLTEALWPDGRIAWLPGAVWRSLQIVRLHGPRVIHSSSWPMTAHLAALIVHRRTGLPWVADFRDPWARDQMFPRSHAHVRYRALARAHAALERAIVGEATYTVVADDSIELVGLPRGHPRRIVIHNGVDSEDLSGTASPPAGDRGVFRLSHVGTVYEPAHLEPVYGAARDLLDRGVLGPREFQLRVVGHLPHGLKLPASFPVQSTGYVEHDRALAEMSAASALLFCRPHGVPSLSGKIFEYLASGRPILCVADPGNLAYRLVQELDAGECADVRDAAAIRQALDRLIAAWRSGRVTVEPHVRDEVLRRFSRRKVAGELGGVLRATMSANAGSGGTARGG